MTTDVPVVPAATQESAARWTGSVRTPILWGVLFGCLQAVSPLSFWWLDPATVFAMEIALIAAVYIGFSVADGRWKVIAVESTVATAFVVIAAAGAAGSAWFLVAGLTAHGLKDLWQHRTQFVHNTRWWPPYCAAVDWVAAALIAIAITAGVHFHN